TGPAARAGPPGALGLPRRPPGRRDRRGHGHARDVHGLRTGPGDLHRPPPGGGALPLAGGPGARARLPEGRAPARQVGARGGGGHEPAQVHGAPARPRARARALPPLRPRAGRLGALVQGPAGRLPHPPL
ncbi:MAG: hypothetical protein AVDCRST_MAG13-3957, partial [uncultured Solirubrobacteraceae bacterium]